MPHAPPPSTLLPPSAQLERTWTQAPAFETWLPTAVKNRELWGGLYARTRLPGWALEAVREVRSPVRLLALSADWCGDAVNSLPWVARLAEASPMLELRVLEQDDHPALMAAHLTGGSSRSIPVVMAFDASWRERGWWGPRPAALQAWVLGEAPGEGKSFPPDERYARVRRWYARDRGVSILRESLITAGVPASRIPAAAFQVSALPGAGGREKAVARASCDPGATAPP